MEPLTCVRSALAELAALPHVLQAVDAFVDPTPRWTMVRAARFGFVRLLDRLASRGLMTEELDVDEAMGKAAKHGHLRAVQWLHRLEMPWKRLDGVEQITWLRGCDGM
ncbi:Ankyrin repeat protein [Phytophthora cinnamomi]|uniref:Ankyrin repeat protein n=1 Tax=Phytophthora cinnamomi TaxID=4785 RepID=UPI00355AB398|nr:Ankyrin repeat protein [Phytophthora cinnamomi]